MVSTDESVSKPTKQRPEPLWRNKDFMLLWSGQSLSTIGTGITQFSFPLLILYLTASPGTAGLAAAFTSLPYLFLSLPAGALIDRWDRKRVMIICDICRAINIFSVPVALYFHRISIIQLFIVSFLEGCFFVFFNLAEASSLPRVVSTEQLPQATAQNEITTSITELVSPSLGGLLFSISLTLPFLTDAISYAASVGSLLLIKTGFQQERKQTQVNLWEQIREGLVWLWQQPLVRFMAFLTGFVNLFTAGSVLVVIVMAQQKGAPAYAIGLIFAIASIGGIVGSLIGGVVQERFRFGTVIIGSCIAIALLYPLYALVPNPFLLGVVNAGIFLVIPLYNVVQFSYRLSLIPDELQGRVNSVFRLLAFGFMPLGQAMTGFLLQTTGATVTIIVTTIGLATIALLAFFNPAIRNARALATQEEE
ncbi:MFS transporter [Tengunoibacter tsumagoiensis]|uniref:MFS transporter n=1 Tax=Tengunoibacter tsumagoiensis TaxID=2014871 RepID=A0A402A656_9CHLR|nr:MFS transporter [Tengunoibacter tsumagoiensis]GCE14612.1 MFS transporter [Tengunoibacter tsumagoiensis]